MPGPVRLAFAALSLGVVLHAAHALSGDAGTGSTFDLLVSGWVYLAIELGAAALCLARAMSLRGRGAGPWGGSAPWIAIAASILFWALGDVTWHLWVGGLDEPPYPSIADALYIAGYVPLYAGVVLLLRERVRPWTRQRWLDGLIGALALAALASEILLPRIVESIEGGLATAVMTIAYPFADVLLLCFVVLGMMVNRRRGDVTWAILAAGLTVVAGADAISSYQLAIGSYAPGTLLNTGWALGLLLFAAAAWQPTPVGPATDESDASTALPGAFLGLALGLLLISALDVAPHIGAAMLSAGAIGAAMLRAGLVFSENRRLLREATVESLTDGLTGLPNRRALIADLESCFAEEGTRGGSHTLAFFDLDGFKAYNDSFGHGAGDDLLRRLGDQLAREVAAYGRAYRLGGDEFCVLFERAIDRSSGTMHGALVALSAHGDRFAVTASVGSVILPREAQNANDALMIADRRMYADKGAGGGRADVRDVLLQALAEREPSLHLHTDGVAALAREVAWRLGARAEELELTVRAAELHDVGKIAIPDAILHKPGPLDAEEWRFMRRHTLIGERIISAASALQPVARLVRSSHERWDGGGYPDGLAGEEIPLASRIILACDAFDAMTTGRAYRPGMDVELAIAHLRHGSGSQFDARVVDALVDVVSEEPIVDGSETPIADGRELAAGPAGAAGPSS
ncbi:MAG: diguanylate cyclase [Solirubrobacteraceae bacterium]|nr:diguanylate cyclase [Solirubrobacteraceae bacterium]